MDSIARDVFGGVPSIISRCLLVLLSRPKQADLGGPTYLSNLVIEQRLHPSIVPPIAPIHGCYPTLGDNKRPATWCSRFEARAQKTGSQWGSPSEDVPLRLGYPTGEPTSRMVPVKKYILSTPIARDGLVLSGLQALLFTPGSICSVRRGGHGGSGLGFFSSPTFSYDLTSNENRHHPSWIHPSVRPSLSASSLPAARPPMPSQPCPSPLVV